MPVSQVIVGDCVEVMARMESCSIDAVVCDPPYGLEFMGKTWDRLDGGERLGGEDSWQAQGRKMQVWHERWAREALRVLKPGGYLLAFGGTRTYHRLACAVEDAGFEIRDRILVERECGGVLDHPTELAWLYGVGFPKSLNVSKAIDKAAGMEREVIGPDPEAGRRNKSTPRFNGIDYAGGAAWQGAREVPATAPATEDAERWQGWGTALKPAHEPIVVARKPLSERNVAANVLRWGTGGINVGATWIEGVVPTTTQGQSSRQGEVYGADQRDQREFVPASGGRWPANVVLVHAEGCVRVGEKREDGMETGEAWRCVEGCPVKALDEQTGELKSGSRKAGTYSAWGTLGIYGTSQDSSLKELAGDSGGASRFFYTAKASRAEREAGLLGKVPCARCGGLDTTEHEIVEFTGRRGQCIRNDHPTVKPVEIMRWLLRLVTPPGGVVLDCFAGSGSTLCAGAVEEIGVVGIEQDERAALIAESRVAYWAEHGEEVLAGARKARKAAMSEPEETTQASLF